MEKGLCKKILVDTDNSIVITRHEGRWGVEEGYGEVKKDGRRLWWRTRFNTQMTYYNCTLETYITLLTNVIPTNSIFFKKQKF